MTFKKDDDVATATIKDGKLHIKGGDEKVLGTLNTNRNKNAKQIDMHT